MDIDKTVTLFSEVNEAFFSKVTDDMYMELTKEDTESMVLELMLSALTWFEFPRIDIYDYDKSRRRFNVGLTQEEINIIATYMVSEWIGQQLATIDNIRMKYSGSDFKFTSQANHIAKLTALKKEYERQGFHLQRLYKRRKRDEHGCTWSTMGEIMGHDTANSIENRTHSSVDKITIIKIVDGGGADTTDYEDIG